MSTPSSTWHADAKPDPHNDRYNCEREDLAMGKLTDDQLANGVFMHGDGTHGRPGIRELLAGTAHMPIAWLTAAKDRIRWLSRKLQHEIDVSTWKPIATAPIAEEGNFLVRRVQNQNDWIEEVFAFEGQMYPARMLDGVDWDARVLDAVEWMALPRSTPGEAKS